MQELVEGLREEIIEQADQVKVAEAMLLQAVKADANCRLLMSIPNIGPINAAALSVALEAPGVFARGRAFAAYLRLVPRQQASADSSALHGIGQMRACEMRSYLVLAAQSLLIRANRLKQPPQDRLLIWAGRLLRRKTRNVAVVAVAAKPESWFERSYPTGILTAFDRAQARNPQMRVYANETYGNWLLLRRPSLRGRLAFDIRVERNLGAGQQTDRNMQLPNRGEAAGDGIAELGRHQLVLDLGRPGRDMVQTIVTHRRDSSSCEPGSPDGSRTDVNGSEFLDFAEAQIS